MTRIKAILFDLDDTLLINDMDTFAPHYFAALSAKFRGICEPSLLLEALQIGTYAMMRNDGTDGTNAETFWRVFFPRIGMDPEKLLPVFEDFYANEFEQLAKYTARDAHAPELVRLAAASGFQIAVATQPLFPLAAIEARLRWAGVGAKTHLYAVISAYDTFSACKPHPHYFETMLRRLGRQPEECLMVGDSLDSDMPAGRLGIRTYLVDRGQAPRSSELPCDGNGTLADLIELIDTGGIHEL